MVKSNFVIEIIIASQVWEYDIWGAQLYNHSPHFPHQQHTVGDNSVRSIASADSAGTVSRSPLKPLLSAAPIVSSVQQ